MTLRGYDSWKLATPPDPDEAAGWPPPRDDDEELLERAAEESYERELTWRQQEAERRLDADDAYWSTWAKEIERSFDPDWDELGEAGA